MPKKGQHHDDSDDKNKSKGRNNPSKSVTITTGTPKKQETYRRQIALHQPTNKQAQAAKAEWNEDTRDKPTIEGSTRARESDIGSGRTGSDSNASSRTRGH